MNDFQVLARFNQWVNGRLYGCAAQLSDEDYRADRGAFFGSVHATLNHILIGDRLWFGRIAGDVPAEIKSLDQILHDDPAALKAAREAMDERIIDIVDGLGDSGLDEEITFHQLSRPGDFIQPARRMLQTVFNHQTHHRGQVHCLLTQAGIEVPPLDVMIYLRGAG
ncbi:MAG: DinB family protein [Rhodospirillales bacterium]|nr:DinB family protein [Rhodospirillales bacterium]